MTLTTSVARRAGAACLAVAAAGIALQILGGADYPAVPPGLIVLALAALLVALRTPRWVLAIAAAATVFISIGGIVTPNLRDQLADPAEVVAFVGSAVQAATMLGALVCCGLALHEAFRRTPADSEVG